MPRKFEIFDGDTVEEVRFTRESAERICEILRRNLRRDLKVRELNIPVREYVKVLFRRDDSLCLYGIPYEMKPGQQPGDIWRSIRDAPYRSPADCWRAGAPYSQPTLPPEGWIWLGSPGWWGTMAREEREEIERFLAEVKDSGGIIPDGPFEWSPVSLKA